MSKELEIEFKNMLTKDEYTALIRTFQMESSSVVTQTNHYFDTPDFRLKERKCALRIRKKENRFECTLKTPAPSGNYEWTDEIDEAGAQALLGGEPIDAPTVSSALADLGVGWRDLQPIGSLTTHRCEFPHEGGLLALDHSEYLGTEDFEVEYEVEDEEQGQKRFLQLLAQHGIPVRPANKKIARFAQAAAKK